MPLATYEDANGHLDGTKIKFVSAEDAAAESREADRIVRSKLGEIFPDYVYIWDISADPQDEPEKVPGLVNEAAALLMASYRYAMKYSEDELNENDYAARLEKRALGILEDIRTGAAVLLDVTYGLPTEEGFGLERDDFWPNDDYTPEYVENQRTVDSRLQPKRAFSMDGDL